MRLYFARCSQIALSSILLALIVLLSTLHNIALADITTFSPVTNSREYLFGVFPYLGPRELEKMYSPVAADYSDAIHATVLFRTNSAYRNFMENLDKQVYDIVFVQPFDYVFIADKYGYRPLATRNKPLPAILVVNPQSSINNVEDLRGKTIALPPSVAAISYMIQNFLSENGIDPHRDVIIKHFDSHGSCMRNVLIGNVDSCGTAPPAFRYFESKMKTKLKIIAKTKGIPNSIFAVHPRVTKENEDKLRSRIVSWQTTEQGKELLENLKVEKFVPVKDSDYDSVREMVKKYRAH